MIIKKTENNRRRSRPNGRRNGFSRSNNGFGNNANMRPKGSVSKILEKYLNLAQDAFSNGDRIKAEGFFQHAEHYQRLMNSTAARSKEVDNNKDSEKLLDSSKKDDVKEIENNPAIRDNGFSRTKRAEIATSKRINKNKENNFTDDGVEALKAFSGSLNKEK